jgi:hypothetical protein
MSLITLKEARAELAMANSYTRMGILIDLAERGMRMSSWLRVLGEEWEVSDNVGDYFQELYEIFEWAPSPALPMMNAAERRVFDALPETVTIYRGCGPHNQTGFSWSLSRDVAADFPFMHRYEQAEPLLVTATIDKEHILAYKDGREEQEIVVFGLDDLNVLSVEKLELDVNDVLTGVTPEEVIAA